MAQAMYNRYLEQPGGPIPEPRDTEPPHPAEQTAAHKSSDLLRDVTGGLSDLLGGLLKNFSLDKLDSGDILLVLILLFLFLEGDNLELVITLGLMLLLGLGED